MTDEIQVEINGVSHTFSEWEEITGILKDVIYWRYKHGKRGTELIAPVREKNRESFCHRDDFDDIFLHCPACGNDFYIEDLGQTMYYSLCPDCGQALNWSDSYE